PRVFFDSFSVFADSFSVFLDILIQNFYNARPGLQAVRGLSISHRALLCATISHFFRADINHGFNQFSVHYSPDGAEYISDVAAPIERNK
ncbi:MAG: hypothetical protein WCJ01_02790, partial [Ignavibacteria bacterium]